jgi:hypothetical protein
MEEREIRGWSILSNRSFWKVTCRNSLSVRSQCGEAPSCWASQTLFDCTSIYWRPISPLISLENARLFKLYQPSPDGLSSRCSYFLFQVVTPMHLNHWFCLPVPQHTHSFLLWWYHFPFSSCVHSAMSLLATQSTAMKLSELFFQATQTIYQYLLYFVL